MEAAKPRRSAGRVLRFIAGTLTLVVIIAWLWIKSVESRRWSHLKRRVAELRREAEARPTARPVLRGSPVPGNAWEDYLKANEIVEKYRDPKLLWFLERLPGADRTATKQYLRNCLPAFALLQVGARRADCRPTGIREGLNYEIREYHPVMGPSGYLGLAALCRSRFLAEEGKTREASELMLDVCQLGHDLVREGTLYAESAGDAVTRRALYELKDLICLRDIPMVDLEEIRRELEILDTSFPPRGPALLGELQDMGQVLLMEKFLSYFARMDYPPKPSDLRSWRYAYSPRLMMVAAFDQDDAWIAKLRDVDLGSWASERQLWSKLAQDVGRENQRNAVLGCLNFCLGSPGSLRRERLARLRLLRTAVAYRITGEAPELEDPFGGTLRQRIVSRMLRVWSIGLSGVDDGGVGEWARPAGKSIVLEVER